MTLILNVATATKVIQVSDRQLTNSDGSIYDDSANKVVCVACGDAHFAIGYTGIGIIDGKRTDEWLVDYLISINASQISLKSIIEAIKEKITEVIKNFPYKRKGITFVSVGYFGYTPFVIHISNIEDEKSIPLNKVDYNSFYIGATWKRLDSNVSKAFIFTYHGMESAVDKPIIHRIKKLNRKRFFHINEGKLIAQELVSIIRATARTPKFGNYIGRNCMAVVITPSNPNTGFEAYYYPNEASPQIYVPHVILPGIAMKRVQLWAGKGPPSWWK